MAIIVAGKNNPFHCVAGLAFRVRGCALSKTLNSQRSDNSKLNDRYGSKLIISAYDLWDLML